MKVFSTFSGIGGFEQGIQKACAALNLPPPEIVGFSEIDRFAASVYQQQFKGVKNYGDITKIKLETLPDFDCLVGGFPCQSFSIAGKRQGFADQRGSLFFDLARILRVKQPRYFVLENVKGLITHDSGRTCKTIITTLTELGYDLQWQVLNSQDFGIPQHRERIIIVGHLRGSTSPQVFPIGGGSKANSNTATKVHRFSKPNRIVVRVPEGNKRGYAEATFGDSVNLAYLGTKTKRGRIGKGLAHTLTASGMRQFTPVRDDRGVPRLRIFTPKECERLQGFPDDWTRHGMDSETISDTQRYKMCGNAVSVPVVQAVFERLLAGERKPSQGEGNDGKSPPQNLPPAS